MYNSKLDIFTAVADSGSFNKAAEKLFISPTAVMKQMNSLEKHVGAKLIERTSHGIKLTKSGEQFYKDAKYIMKYSADAIKRIRQIQNSEKYAIRVGTSVLNPCKALMDLWGQVNDIYSHFKINVIPFEDDHNNILNVIGNIGKTFDFIVGACDSPQWLAKCNFLKLGEYKECVAVPRNHPLSSKKLIKIEDLHGESMFIVAKGVSNALDRLHDELEEQHPEIHTIETSYYDIDVFNRCEDTGSVMLTLDAWSEVHPSLVTIPVDWDYTIPYGILYPKNPSEYILHFLDAIKAIM